MYYSLQSNPAYLISDLGCLNTQKSMKRMIWIMMCAFDLCKMPKKT